MEWQFLGAYAALMLIAWSCRSWQMGRSSLAMLGNWIINSLFVLATGNFSPWLWFAVVDFLTAFFILKKPAGQWQAAIGWVYIAQIVLHLCYGLAGNPDAELPYWLWLTRLAYVQIGLVALWGGRQGGRRIRDIWVRRRSGNAVPSGMGSVGR